jgi:hypothetical protein
VTRRIALDRPPDGARVDGIILRDRHPLPEQGEIVLVEVYGKRWRRLARVCQVDEVKKEYSVELMEKSTCGR